MDEQVRPTREMTDRPVVPTRRGRRSLWPWALLALLVIGVVVWHPWSRGAKPGPSYTPPIPVGVATSRTGSMDVILTELGTVTPLATVTVQSQISGYLLSVDYKEGQDVRRGQLLALVDPRPYEATLEQYQAQLARDQASYQQAKMDLARYQTLGKQQSIATQTLQDQVYTVAADAATLKVDQAQIDTQKLDIAYCHVTSPVDGRVGLRQVDAGNYVTSSESTGLVVITQLQPISVIFTVAEDEIQPILGKTADGHALAVAAYDRTDTNLLASGSLETIDNQVDTSTGTVKLRAIFPNADERLFPNEFVNARLKLDTLANVVLVPNAAVQNGPNGPYVYLVQPMTADEVRRAREARARARTHASAGGAGGAQHRHASASDANATEKVVVRLVKTGHSDGTNTVVTGGLASGDQVVTDGLDRLKDGAPITIAAGGAAGSAARSGSIANKPSAAAGTTVPGR